MKKDRNDFISAKCEKSSLSADKHIPSKKVSTCATMSGVGCLEWHRKGLLLLHLI